VTNWTEEQLAAKLRDNPDIRELITAAEFHSVLASYAAKAATVTGCTVDMGQDASARTGSPLEARFAAMWQQIGGPPLEREHRFAAPRRWRADFAHVAARVLVELEGGTHSGGRHTRHAGFRGDCEKYNAAQRLGWQVYRYTGDMLTPDALAELAAHMRQMEAVCSGHPATVGARRSTP